MAATTESDQPTGEDLDYVRHLGPEWRIATDDQAPSLILYRGNRRIPVVRR